MTLSDIQRSFTTRSFDVESIDTWLIGVATVALMLVMWLAIKSLLARRVRYYPHGSITDPRMIRNIMRTAFDQRRPLEVQVQTDSGGRRPTLRCSPEYLGNDSFTVEINGLKSLSDKWLHRAINVFFRIQVNKEFTYYTFSSTIEAIHLPRQGVCHISLPIPTSLENRQKRSFLRMAPPPEFFMGAALWHDATMPTPENMSNLDKWPRPKLLALPERMEQFRLLDLSAGGMRIAIPHQVAKTQDLHFASVEQIIVMIDLFDPEHSKRLRFWLQCRIQNVWVEHVSRDVHMGVQFAAWARPKDVTEYGEKAGGIEWLRLSSSNEVEPIGNWIMRRHLELFREVPVDM